MAETAKGLDTLTPYGTFKELLKDYRPTKFWHGHSATEAQYSYLARFGVPRVVLTKGQASHVIAKVLDQEPPTQLQECFLRERGLWYPEIRRGGATRLIGCLVPDDDED